MRMRRFVITAGLAMVALLACGMGAAGAAMAAAMGSAAQGTTATPAFTSGTMSAASATTFGSWYAYTPKSALTPLIPAVGPTNTAPPTITGSATVGSTLTANQGAWNGTPPIVYSYQWQTCDSSGANCVNNADTSTTYPVTSADIGTTLVVVETATDITGANSANSAADLGGSGPAGQHRSGAGDQRQRDGGVHAHGHKRRLVQRPEHLHLPMADLRLGGRELHQQLRHELHVLGDLG